MAPEVQQGEVTRLLLAMQEGQGEAKNQFARLVYEELRSIAAGLLHEQDESHSLPPPALVPEAYLRLDRPCVFENAPNRHYFFAAAAHAMRQILVDHARRRHAEKRGEGWRRV